MKIDWYEKYTAKNIFEKATTIVKTIVTLWKNKNDDLSGGSNYDDFEL